MQPFIYNALPSRVIFGTGTLSQVPQEIKRLGCSKALILTTPQQVKEGESLKELIGDLAVGIYTNATMHTPTDVTDEAVGVAHKLGADCVVALGGGSTIGLGKAIALRTDLPQIVIPTSYAGSEVRHTRFAFEYLSFNLLPILTGNAYHRPDRKRPEDDTEDPESSSRSHHLRCLSYPYPAPQNDCHVRLERYRPCRRGALRSGSQSHHRPPRTRRH